MPPLPAAPSYQSNYVSVVFTFEEFQLSLFPYSCTFGKYPDNLFYQLKPCHYCSLPSERKPWVPFFTIEPLFLALPTQLLYNVDIVPKKVIGF